MDMAGLEDGLGDAKETYDGHILPIGIYLSSEATFPPSWIRVEPTNNL